MRGNEGEVSVQLICTQQGLWEALLGPGGAESALGWGWSGEAEKTDTELALKELTVSLGKDTEKHIKRQKDWSMWRSFVTKQGSLRRGGGTGAGSQIRTITQDK